MADSNPAPADSHDHDDHHGVGHVVPLKVLVATGSALIVLTVVTVLAAKVDFAHYQMPELNIIVALGIALVKASLVCLFFMHLFWDRSFHSFVFVSSIALVTLFIGFAMTDTFEYRYDVNQYEVNTLQGAEAPKVQEKLDALPKISE